MDVGQLHYVGPLQVQIIAVRMMRLWLSTGEGIQRFRQDPIKPCRIVILPRKAPRLQQVMAVAVSTAKVAFGVLSAARMFPHLQVREIAIQPYRILSRELTLSDGQ